MKHKSNSILHVAIILGEEELPVGRMVEKENRIWFEYHSAFRQKGLEISPLHLPLNGGVVSAKYQPFEGLFGLFNDSLPDGWGRLLLDRALATRGIALQGISTLDRLAYTGRGGMGALIYHPEITLQDEQDSLLNLNQLADEMSHVLEGEASDMLDQLYLMGGSSSGARPKIVAGYHPATGTLIHGGKNLPKDYEHWLIKFPSSADRPDVARIEYAYSQMTKAAGIEMSETKLFPGNKGRMYFGTKRFDREKNLRYHAHTASGLLQADHRVPSLDYAVLMNLAMKLNTDIREAERLYRLAAFNVLAHNQDDHGKNFSFLMNEKGEWRFAPAYDLVFSFGPSRQHCTTVLRNGLPLIKDLLALGEMFGIRHRKAIVEEVKDAVSRWSDFAKAAGVSAASENLVQKALQPKI